MSDEQPIFDYASAAPWAQVIEAYGDEEGLNAAIGEMVADGKRKDECWEAIWDREVRRFESDAAFRADVREIYRRAGVDLLSVTPWVHDSTRRERPGQRRDLSRWQARFDAAEWLKKVTSPAEARAVADGDGVGIILNTQNVDGAIDGALEDIDTLYNEGVRIFQLTYNRQNRLGTGCNDPSEGGLSTFGRAAVDRLNELGAVVDVSHCGKRTTLDTIEYSADPVAVTHAGCRAIKDHYRGKSDEELEALSAADGYMGVVGLPWFITPAGAEPTLDILIEHIEHASSILGRGNVGLGTDFYPADARFPAELKEYYGDYIASQGFEREDQRTVAGGLGAFETFEDWPVIEDRLREWGSPSDVAGVLGGNFLDFWERVV